MDTIEINRLISFKTIQMYFKSGSTQLFANCMVDSFVTQRPDHSINCSYPKHYFILLFEYFTKILRAFEALFTLNSLRVLLLHGHIYKHYFIFNCQLIETVLKYNRQVEIFAI